jgi:predicted dehydrogenase
LKRRDFLKTTSTAAAGLAGLTIIPASVMGKRWGFVSPSDKVNLACVGIGNRGGEIIREFHKTGLCNIVALCDADMGAKHTLATLEQFPNVPRFKDFREMFDLMGKKFDAISVGIPDFSHFPATMLAITQGKGVYVEKPLAQTFREIELLMQAEAKYKVPCQMGNQGHSEENYFQFKTWVEAGIIKDVTSITAFMNNSRRWHGMVVNGPLTAEPVPDTLDWDKWISSAPFRDYNKGYINGEWRSWYGLGNGALGDWGAHIVDTAHEFLHLGLPTEVNAVALEGHSPDIFPQASTLLFKFPARKGMPALDITWYDGVKNLPPLPDNFGSAVTADNIPPPSAGSAAAAKLPPGKVIYGKDITFKGGSHGSALQMLPSDAARQWITKLPEVPKSPSNHFANFLKACRGEETCRSRFAVSGPLCQMMNLGVIAQQLNAQLKFDPAEKKVTNNNAANDLLQGPPPRKGWEQFYKILPDCRM